VDEVLVARARAGDREAFEVLIRTEAPSLLRLAMAIVLDRDRAADVAQDALVAAWQQLHQLRDPARFDAWLRRIVINRSRNALRERRPYRLTEGIVPAVSMPLDERPGIEAALRKLDPRHREVVALFGATMSDVVVFGDRLIAVGVQPGGTGGLDSAVWTSLDGRRWARVEYQPAFDGADMSQVVVLGDRLIVLGRTGNEAGQEDGAVWTSDDGEAWLRIEDDDAFGGPGWQQINGVTVVSGSVVAVGTSYVLHDDHREARSVGVVWLSRDGENWRRVDDARGVFATDPLTSIQGVTAAGPGAIAVGSRAIPGEAPNAFDDRSRAAVWFSADGAVWEPLSDRPEFSSEPRLTMARISVADDGRLIAFGTSYRELGSTGTSEGDIAVWISDAPEGALEVP